MCWFCYTCVRVCVIVSFFIGFQLVCAFYELCYSRPFSLSAMSTVHMIFVSWWSKLFSHFIVMKTFSDLTERGINPVFLYLWSELWEIFIHIIFGLLVFPLDCFLKKHAFRVYLKSSHICCGRHFIWFSIPHNKAPI